MQLPLHAESCTMSNSAAGFNTELGLISSQIINNLSQSQEETFLPYKGEKHTLQWPAWVSIEEELRLLHWKKV